MAGASVHLDRASDLSYVTLTDGSVARTVEYAPEIQVDLDQYGVVVGVELLTHAVNIDVDDLAARFHIHSDQVLVFRAALSLLRSFQTSIKASSAGPAPKPGVLRSSGSRLIPA